MATTNQPDTPLFFKPSNTRFSYTSNEFTEYAKTNKDNLYIAILAGLSFHDLRCTIIDEFEAKLRGLLEGRKWSVIDDKYFTKEHTWSKGYWAKFRKSNWPERIYVGIEPSRDFSIHNFGVIANIKQVQFDKLQFNRNEFSARLKEIIGDGLTSDHCVWKSKLSVDYADLNSAEGLMALSKFRREEKALNYFAGKINAVGDALDSFFSEVASRK